MEYVTSSPRWAASNEPCDRTDDWTWSSSVKAGTDEPYPYPSARAVYTGVYGCSVHTTRLYGPYNRAEYRRVWTLDRATVQTGRTPHSFALQYLLIYRGLLTQTRNNYVTTWRVTLTDVVSYPIARGWPVSVNYLTALTNVGQHQKQDGRRETGSGNILGCTTDTDEIVILIPKSAGLTNTVNLLSTSTDIDRSSSSTSSTIYC